MTTDAAITDLLTSASYAAAGGNRHVVSDYLTALSRHDASRPALVDHVVGAWLDRHVRATWDGGWQPVDLTQYARRKVDETQQRLLRDAIAAEQRRYAASDTDTRWSDQLGEIGATPWWHDTTGVVAAWSSRYGLTREAVLQALTHLAGFLVTLPRLPVLIPPPGDPQVSRAQASQPYRGRSNEVKGVDGKVLGRVRALLAKAESTDFPEEAEALSAKAQEMMTKYALDRAVIDLRAGSTSGGSAEPIARRVWVDPPYAAAKTFLVAIVGGANGCKCVSYDSLGFVTVVGDQPDVDLVEILATSLLVQADRAMLSVRTSGSRTRSFRRAFLISYADRIGERLSQAKHRSEQAVSAADRERVLPVLAHREAAVEQRFSELFPTVRTRRTTISNRAGWAAGRAAADQASLNARTPVDRR